MTELAVFQFQNENGLGADSIVGDKTKQALWNKKGKDITLSGSAVI